jgi:hypothetical protein
MLLNAKKFIFVFYSENMIVPYAIKKVEDFVIFSGLY